MLPLKTAISDTYPNPSNTTARLGFAQLWDALNEATQAAERELASSATTDIGGQLSNKLRITGTNTISSFGTNYRGPIPLRFAAAVPITHNATTLRCPGGASYTTTAGEAMLAWPISSTSGTADGWQLVSLDSSATLTAATAAVDTSTTQVATTAFVTNQAGSATPLVDAATAVVGTSKRYARADHVHPGVGLAASQAEMETAASNVVTVTPSVMKYHPGMAKAWVAFNGTGTPAILASYGVSSITDNGVGDYTINLSVTFSSVNYAVFGFAEDENATNGCIVSRHSTNARTATTFRCRVFDSTAGAAVDVGYVCLSFFGDL
jgi:hypothetical protein